MTQTLAALDHVLARAPGHLGAMSLRVAAPPAAGVRGRSAASVPDWLKNPTLAYALVDVAERAQLLPPSTGYRGRSATVPTPEQAAQLRAAVAPGQVEKNLHKLQALRSRRDQAELRQLALTLGLLPRPRCARTPSPLGENDPYARPQAVARGRRERGEVSPKRGLLVAGVRTRLGAFRRQLQALATGSPGDAARALLNLDFEASLRSYAGLAGKVIVLPRANLRLLLLHVADAPERAATQARFDRENLDELVQRYELTPWPAAQAPNADPRGPMPTPTRFGAYGLDDHGDDATTLYRWQERDGRRGLFEAVSLSFVEAGAAKVRPDHAVVQARVQQARALQNLLATHKVLPRLVAKAPAVPGARVRLAGHHPVEFYVDTPAARDFFAAEDATMARKTMLQLNLDVAGLRVNSPVEPRALAFARPR